MNLRSDNLFWINPAVTLDRGPLSGDLQCDVAVIGSGVSGALAAYHLTQAGINSVVMLDRRPVGKGSVGASTALLQYEMDTRLADLGNRIGPAKATRCYQLCLEALSHFDDIVADLRANMGVDVDYRRRQSLYLAGEDADFVDLDREYRARRAAGIDVAFLDRSTLQRRYGIAREAALLSRDAAEVDPVKFTNALLAQSAANGLSIYGSTAVKRYDPAAAGVTLWTDAGHRIQAKRVIFATGYETQDFLGESVVTLSSTFAVVSEPVAAFPKWDDRCLVWEAATPYFYCRTTADNRVIIGGEDEATIDPATRDAMMPDKTKTLVAKFRELFPQIPFTPAKTWAGTFAESDDSLPLIGTHPRFPSGYFALGYGGNGITFALIAARLIRDDLLGRPSDDAKLFAFDREQPTGVGAWAMAKRSPRI